MNQQPLGALLVRRGLITEEQLAVALADQRATGAPLGQIVVSRGYAAAAAVAQALATQHGGLLKTEYGFATGFDSGGPPTSFVPPPVTPDAVAETRIQAPAVSAAVRLEADEVAGASETDREALRAEVSSAAGAAEKLRADNARLTELRPALEQRLASEAQRAASLERELADANEQNTSLRAAAPPPEDERRISELETALAARDAALEEWKAGILERDRALDEFRIVAEEWKAGLAGRDAALAELASGRDAALAQLREAKGALAAWEATVHELTVAWDEAVAQARAAAADEAAAHRTRVSALTRERDKALESLRATEAELALLPALQDEVLSGRQAAGEAAARIDGLRAERDDALADLRSARAELAELAAARDKAPLCAEDRWASAQRHLVFFQGPKAYELLERDGPPPAPGSRVSLEHGVQVVARVGASPTPGARIPCAYLVA